MCIAGNFQMIRCWNIADIFHIAINCFDFVYAMVLINSHQQQSIPGIHRLQRLSDFQNLVRVLQNPLIQNNFFVFDSFNDCFCFRNRRFVTAVSNLVVRLVREYIRHFRKTPPRTHDIAASFLTNRHGGCVLCKIFQQSYFLRAVIQKFQPC